MDSLEQELTKVHSDCAAALLRHLAWFVADPAEAQDLLQEALVRYLLYRRRGKQVDRPLKFLYRTATRLAIRTLRKSRRRHELDEFLPMPADPRGPDVDLAVTRTLRAIWPRLDEKGQLVAKATLMDEMTPLEIAEFTGLSRATVGRRLARIRRIASRTGELDGLQKKMSGSGRSRPLKDEQGGDEA